MLLPTSPVKAMVWGVLAVVAAIGLHLTGVGASTEELACLRGAPRPGGPFQRFATGVLRAKDPAASRRGLVLWEEHERASGRSKWTLVDRRALAEGTLEDGPRRTPVSLVMFDPSGLAQEELPDGHRLRGVPEGGTVTVLGDRIGVGRGGQPIGDELCGTAWMGTPAEVEARLVARGARAGWIVLGLLGAGVLAFACGLTILLARRGGPVVAAAAEEPPPDPAPSS